MTLTHGPRSRLPAWLALLALLPLPALGGPAILLAPVIGRPTQVTVIGRVLREAPTAGSSTFSRNLRQLAAPNWSGAPVEVIFGGQKVRVLSGHDGAFEVTFPAPAGGAFALGAHRVHAQVPGAMAVAPVEIVSDAAPFIVISDFDDTVARSDVTSKTAMMKVAFLRDADSHPPVEGMGALYRCLRDGPAATKPGFAFVSGSPVQFWPRISAFLGKHQFPFGGVYLRDIGPKTLSGYKQPVLRKLLSQFPQPVILFGDNGEHDPEVYAQLRQEFPGRVLDILIRDAGGPGGTSRTRDMLLFKDASEAAARLATRGWITQACAQQAFPALAPPAAAGSVPAADAGTTTSTGVVVPASGTQPPGVP